MAWKIERMTEALHSEAQRVAWDYDDVSPRELVIVAAGFLDVLLAEMICLRMIEDPECDQFLGADGDGRAPAATLGAKTQLAFLLGLVDRDEAERLKHIKRIRNEFAHRVVVDFTADKVQPSLRMLCTSIAEASALVEGLEARAADFGRLIALLSNDPAAGRQVFCEAFALLYVGLDDRRTQIRRVQDAFGRPL
jgi:hypothetical protein